MCARQPLNPPEPHNPIDCGRCEAPVEIERTRLSHDGFRVCEQCEIECTCLVCGLVDTSVNQERICKPCRKFTEEDELGKQFPYDYTII